MLGPSSVIPPVKLFELINSVCYYFEKVDRRELTDNGDEETKLNFFDSISLFGLKKEVELKLKGILS